MTVLALLMALHGADMPFTLAQAVERARDSATANLSAGQRVADDSLTRREVFGHLLPKVELSATQLSQSANIATYGFSMPGLDPYVPFYSIQDVRLGRGIIRAAGNQGERDGIVSAAGDQR